MYWLRAAGVVHLCLIRLPIAVLHPAVEVHLLDDDAEPVGPVSLALLGADLVLVGGGDTGSTVGVLDVEDGLVSVNEGGEGLALRVLDALLVDGEVNHVDDLADDVASVLQADGHVVLSSLLGKKLHVVDGVLLCETKAVVILL